MRFLSRLVALAMISGRLFAEAAYLPENHSVNGGLTIIPIDIKQQPQVYYHDKKIPVLPSPNANQWLLIVGIPLDTTRAVENLTITHPVRSTIPFQVSQKFYATQQLKITDPRKVDPYEEDRARITKEAQEMAALFTGFTAANPFSQGFKAPVHGPVSSLFGLKRVYNKSPQAPHSGLDIAAPENTPITASAKGQVVAVKDYFFTGNTVIVDHGMGVYSLYAHLKAIAVKEGQWLNQGDSIGTVGKTGRATGPHLHWSMIVNQTLVDPLLFVPYRLITVVPAASNSAAKRRNHLHA
ncbi:peptidase, M23/M37 family [Legionella rubrilucens]|uniref:Peptidase, M23/M37 family n=1 Tax=Legionella rubrilucens TaxID=458 RepID=A0A0W0XW31_9GAMM|nr:M23 family metallopeptidase [Legionella rubrilucens]KTD48860.1 peptidase, M23/M37 family [Legionella rubrilucens]